MYSRSTASMRVCQPDPLALEYAGTAHFFRLSSAFQPRSL